MIGTTLRVLVIEDDSDDFLMIQEQLAEADEERFVLEWVSTYESGVAAALNNQYDVILVDHRLGARTGIDLIRELQQSGCRAPAILLTGARDRDLDRAAVKAGASDYLSKGFIDSQALVRSIRLAIERRAHEEAQQQLRDREIEIGARIQSALLLGKPPAEFQGVTMGGVVIPSQKVDGDFWGFFAYDYSRFDIVVGDVMGKGVPAALLGAAAKATYESVTRRLALALKEFARLPDPEEIVGALNFLVTRDLSHFDSFVTLLCCRFDMESLTISVVDAGHMPLIHYSPATGDTSLISGTNVPVGVLPDELYVQQSLTFQRGDVFVFYSDGVTEARNAANELFGTERLLEMVRQNAHLEAQQLAESIRDAVVDFAGREGLRDDLTCLVVKVSPDKPRRPLRTAGMEVHSRPGQLEDLRRFVSWFCDHYVTPSLTEYERSSLILAVSEAVANILNHAYWGSRNRRVQVYVASYPGEVQVDIADFGRPFSRSSVQEPVFDGSQIGGFGVYIIEHSVDEHRYYRDELGRNHLCVVRKALGRTDMASDVGG